MARALHQCGRLHAFEPVQANFKRLGDNVLKNGLKGMVELHSVGLSDREALVWISLREDFATGAGTGNAAIVIDSIDQRFAREEIKVFPLDGRVFESLGVDRLDFIKVDIEGHEDRFLAGAKEVIRRFRPIIYLEINDSYYMRRGLDPTGVFDDWMDVNSYKAALLTHARWKLDRLRHRKPALDNVFLLPSERAEDLARRIALEARGILAG
jgi:FkbM family methyltransferase